MSRSTRLPSVTGLARRASWNVIDQVLSALSNVALSFVVARAVDATAFGAFAIAFLVFSLSVGAERALVGEPMSINHSAAEGVDARTASGSATATALALGALVGAVCLVVGLALGGQSGPALIAVGLVLPGLLLQDACRMVFFALGQPRRATVNDGLWVALQAVVMAVLVLVGTSSSVPFIFAWGGSALAAGLVGLGQMRAAPLPRRVRSWVEDNWRLTGYLLAEFVLGVGAFQGGVLLVGAVVGVSDVGSLRAAQVLIGPVSVFAMGVFTFSLPELSRRRSMSARQRSRAAGAISGLVVAVTALYGAVVLLMPDAVGEALLGDTWRGASSVLLATLVGSAANGAGLGPSLVAYSMGQARSTFRVHLVAAPLLVVCVLVGVSVAGVQGAAWGMSTSFVLVMPLWYLQMRQLLRGTGPFGSTPTPPPAADVVTESNVRPEVV